ncbi:hypothetical protein BCV70DRAFT_232060 [Testicularia cyperi]|uniref:Uncharacterized protein n=1 Tax=Testicularia cyperi TaxID=1882483 RepID=A0A317XN16_9BASI|nr:hypothetical protein BCV70DRAFT_232060 [Testicularia cyperi]
MIVKTATATAVGIALSMVLLCIEKAAAGFNQMGANDYCGSVTQKKFNGPYVCFEPSDGYLVDYYRKDSNAVGFENVGNTGPTGSKTYLKTTNWVMELGAYEQGAKSCCLWFMYKYGETNAYNHGMSCNGQYSQLNTISFK